MKKPISDQLFREDMRGIHFFWGSILSFCLFAGYLFVVPQVGFQHDAKEYWEIGSLFFRNGHFSLYNYDQSFVGQTFRGYSFPLLCLGLQGIARLAHISDFFTVGLFSAAYFAILCGWLIPVFVRNVFSIRPRLWQSLALSLCLFIFWRGYLCYPLTDFVSLFLLVAGLNLMVVGGAWNIFCAGFLLGLASNMRPAYAIALYLSVAFAGVRILQSKDGKVRQCLTVCAIVPGILLALIPQSLVNHRNFHSWSPGVVTAALHRGLYFQNMEIGFTTQRFETNVGQNYPTAAVLFADPGAVELFRKESSDGLFGYRMLARAALHSPLKLAAVYWRHFCNGLDIRYSTVYVPNIYDRPELLALLNYSIIYLAIVMLFSMSLREAFTWNRLYAILVVAALCVVVIPVRIETRYFLPAYMSLYLLVIYFPHYRSLTARYSREQWAKVLAGYVAFLVAYTAYSDEVFRQITPGR